MSVGRNELALSSPLVGLSQGLADALVRQGYAPGTVHAQKKLLADLSDWLQAQGLTAGDLTSGQVDRFFGARRSAGITRHKTRMALGPILDYLRGLEVVPPFEAVVADGPASAVLDRYRRFLRVERSLVSGTGDRYVGCLRPFLDRSISADGLGLELGNLSPADVTAFVVAWCPRLNSGVAKLTITALRSFLGFLHLDGITERSLVGAVPKVPAAGWPGCPRGLNPIRSRAFSRPAMPILPSVAAIWPF